MITTVPSIQHVSLEVEPGLVDDEVRFWELLGFEPIEPPEGIGGSSFWMGAGDQAIHLLAVEAPRVPGEGHVALLEPDLEPVLAALAGAGFRVEEAAPHWGAERFKATSPSGHLVEVMAARPG
jgi:catechol 2,3-dioxygenase-like lactoylglutathione lyase family enzyme